MTVRSRDQGYRFHAERRGRSRTIGLEGLPLGLKACRRSRAIAKRRRDIPCPLPLPDTLAGCRAQVICRNLPAKLLCTRSRGRVPARTAGGVCPASWSPSVGAKMGLGESFPVQVRKSDQETYLNGALIQT